jgi:nucleoside-diphosphate-sugar epimerase
MMSKLVTVTGAGGFVGSILVGQLLRSGYTVQALDRFFFGSSTLRDYFGHDRLRLRTQDIRNVSAEDLAGSWAVIDLAALSNDPSGDLDPHLTEEINQRGRINVARAAKRAGVERYVFSSSCSVYGAGNQANLTESSPLFPQTAYAKCCAIAEETIRAMNGPGFTATALRLSTLFGLSPRMRFDLVVNIMTLHAFQKRCISVIGGDQWRPLLAVNDAARAFRVALEGPAAITGGNVFNVGLTNMQVKDIAETVRQALPYDVAITTQPNPLDRRDYNVSFERAKSHLGFTAQQSLADNVLTIHDALAKSLVRDTDRTRTVIWYKNLLVHGISLSADTAAGRVDEPLLDVFGSDQPAISSPVS